MKYIAIGEFRLDLRAGELRRNGYTVRLQEQPFTILKLLAENPGKVVLREEIRKRLWPNDTLVDFDHSVNAAIAKLRDALRDKAKAPRYIETVARRGYRLIAKVEEVETADPSPVPETTPTPQTASPENLIGALIGRYRLDAILGGGGMGLVYRAEDLTLGRPVALKFPPPEQWGDADSRARLEREARAGAALDHPNICHIYEVSEHEGKAFLAMQFLRGESLAQRLASGPLPPSEAVSIAARVAAGLEAAHRAGFIHGDIKPANIFLTVDGEVKILDFGLAHPISHVPGAPAGTAAYMSPEQSACEPLDARSDIFSLGRVLWDATTDPRPPMLEAVIRKAIQPDRERRYQSAAEFRMALEGIRLSRPLLPWMIAAVLGLILIGVAGALWIKTSEPPATAERSLTGNTPEDAVDAASVSPSGGLLAFARGTSLFAGPVTDLPGRTKRIELAAPIRTLAWSHDSKRVYAALQDGRLYVVDPYGTGAPVLIREHAGSPAVSPDDSTIAFLDESGNSLAMMRRDGSAAEAIFHVRPDFHLVYPHWANADTLVFGQTGFGSENCGGWITTWSATTRQSTDIVRLTSCLGGIASLSHSRILYFTRSTVDGQLYEIPLTGAASPRLLRDHLGKVDSLTTGDSGAIYYRKMTEIVAVYAGDFTSGGSLVNVHRVSAAENNSNYVHGWTADSRSVLFESLRGNQYFVFRKAIDDTGPDVPLSGSEDGVGPKLSPDGAWVLFNRSVKLPSGEPASNYQLVRLPIAGGVAEIVADDPGAFNFHCGASPGKRCVLLAEHGGRLQFQALDPLHGVGAELATIDQRPTDWDLSPDGNRLAMVSGDAPGIHVIDLSRNVASHVKVPGWTALHTINWSADGAGWLLCADRAPAPGAFLVRVNGSGMSVLHQFKAPCPWAVASPDGRHLAFSESSPGINVRTLVP